jgi:hypothetical protein
MPRNLIESGRKPVSNLEEKRAVTAIRNRNFHFE